jgi:hypothetical protein
MTHRALVLPLAAAVLAAWLAGCAPAATGSSAGSAFSITDAHIRATPGATIYVSGSYTLDQFGMKTKDLSSGWMWVPIGYDRAAAIITTNFELTGVQAATGWSVTLDEVRVYRKTVQGQRTFDPSSVQRSLSANLKIVVPADAIAGPYPIRGTLTRRTSSVPVALQVEVVR